MMGSGEGSGTDDVGVVRDFEPSRCAAEAIRACYEAVVPITRKAVDVDGGQGIDDSQRWREAEGA